MAKAIVRKPAVPVKPAAPKLPPSKPSPPMTFISRAPATNPFWNTDVRKHLGTISERLREVVKFEASVYHLTELDDQNPVIIGATHFLDVLMDRVTDLADGIDEVVGMLQPAGKGGAE